MKQSDIAIPDNPFRVIDKAVKIKLIVSGQRFRADDMEPYPELGEAKFSAEGYPLATVADLAKNEASRVWPSIAGNLPETLRERLALVRSER